MVAGVCEWIITAMSGGAGRRGAVRRGAARGVVRCDVVWAVWFGAVWCGTGRGVAGRVGPRDQIIAQRVNRLAPGG